MPSSLLILLILFQIKHVLCDFVFQTGYQVRNKGTYGHPGGLAHAGTHALGTFVVVLITGFTWPVLIVVPVAEFVVHYHLDWFKEYVLRHSEVAAKRLFWSMLGLDQMWHQLTYVAIVAALYL